MRLFALMLAVALPASGWAQALGPAYPQAEAASDAPVATALLPGPLLPQAIIEAAPFPLYRRWQFWTGVGGVAGTLIAGSIAIFVASQVKPSPAPTPRLNEICGPGGCDACVGFSCP